MALVQEGDQSLKSMFRTDLESLEHVIATLSMHTVCQSQGTKPLKPATLQI